MPRINGENVTVFKKLNIAGNLYIGGQLYTKGGSTPIGNANYTTLNDVAIDRAYFQGDAIEAAGSAIPDDFRGTRFSALNITENLAINGQVVADPLVYTQNRVVFDGTNDFLDLSGTTVFDTTDEITISFWCRCFNTAITTVIFNNRIAGTNTFLALMRIGAGTEEYFYRSMVNDSTLNPNTIFTTCQENVLQHFILSISWVTGAFKWALDDVVTIEPNVSTGNKIPFENGNEYQIGALDDATGKYIGELGDIWVAQEYIDLSVEANRRKFIDASGNPVSLGADGSLPTGNQPAFFFGDAQTAADWNAGTNLGSGPNMTMNGAVTDA